MFTSIYKIFNSLLHLLNNTHRGVYSIIVGITALCFSAVSDWHLLPASVASSVTFNGLLNIVESKSIFELMLRILIILFLTLTFYALIYHRTLLIKLRWPAWFLLGAVISFPYFINLWTPDILLDSNLLHVQIDRVVANMEDNFIQQQTEWRRWQQLNVSPSNIASIENFVIDDWDLEIFNLNRQIHLFQNILGFSDAFYNFSCKGWIFAIIGLITILIGIYLSADSLLEHYYMHNFTTITCIYIVSAILLLTPRFISDYYFDAGQQAFERGEPQSALLLLKKSKQWKPSLEYSLAYYTEIGKITSLLGCQQCPETLLYQASNFYKNNELDKSRILLEQLIKTDPNFPFLPFWLGLVYSDLGINAFNQGQYSLAEQYWWQAVYHLPIDAMAWYGLSLVHLRFNEYRQAADYLDQILKLQQYFTFKSLTIHGQQLLYQSWAAYQRGDIAASHQLFSHYLTPENW